MRSYRNSAVEEWVGAVAEGDAAKARAANFEETDTIWLTRSLDAARQWARPKAVGGQRSGLIGSGQARRLAAEGLFVDYKPDIATWMLAPSSDIRSSNALETVQKQVPDSRAGVGLLHRVLGCGPTSREGDRWVA